MATLTPPPGRRLPGRGTSRRWAGGPGAGGGHSRRTTLTERLHPGGLMLLAGPGPRASTPRHGIRLIRLDREHGAAHRAVEADQGATGRLAVVLRHDHQPPRLGVR